MKEFSVFKELSFSIRDDDNIIQFNLCPVDGVKLIIKDSVGENNLIEKYLNSDELRSIIECCKEAIEYG